MHGRNLDFGFIDKMRPLTVKLDWVRGNRVVFRSIQVLGTIGVFTGTKPNMFGVSENERNLPESRAEGLKNTLVSLFLYKGTLISLAIREALENATSFDDAVNRITATKVIAPGYVILSGTKKDEGVVITKGRVETADVYRLNAQVGRWYVVQTNNDRWQEPERFTRWKNAVNNLLK